MRALVISRIIAILMNNIRGLNEFDERQKLSAMTDAQLLDKYDMVCG